MLPSVGGELPSVPALTPRRGDRPSRDHACTRAYRARALCVSRPTDVRPTVAGVEQHRRTAPDQLVHMAGVPAEVSHTYISHRSGDFVRPVADRLLYAICRQNRAARGFT